MGFYRDYLQRYWAVHLATAWQLNSRATRLEFAIVLVVLNVLCLLSFGLGGLAGIIRGLSLLAMIGMSIRRMHDLGKSGWWVLLLLIPVVNIIVLLGLLFLPGHPGANAFGEESFDAKDDAAGRYKGPAAIALALHLLFILYATTAVGTVTSRFERDEIQRTRLQQD